MVVLGEPFLPAPLSSFPTEASAFIDVTHTQLLCLNIHFQLWELHFHCLKLFELLLLSLWVSNGQAMLQQAILTAHAECLSSN